MQPGLKGLCERAIPLALSAVVVLAMVAVAEASGQHELLFPEITAILCGAWVLPRQAWRVDRPRMLALMALGSVFGLALNLLVPLPVWPRAVIAYAFCAVCMCLLGANMAPMLSSAILPVLLGTESWAYPAAVVVLVAIVCAGQVLLERRGLREPIEFEVQRPTALEALRDWTPRLVVFALLSLPAYATGNPFFAVPPLVVAFTELSEHGCESLYRTRATLMLAALAGGFGRIVVEELGAPLVPIVALCLVALVAIWAGFGTWLPPAGAIVLLAFLVPYDSPTAYMAQAMCGAIIWAVAGYGLHALTHHEPLIPRRPKADD